MLSKNTHLLVNFCRVKIRSVWGQSFPQLAEIYTTLSKIKLDDDGEETDDGILYGRKLTLFYPGLDADQFKNIDKLLKGKYEIQGTTSKGDVYEIAGPQNPMGVKTTYSDGNHQIIFSHKAIEPIKHLGDTPPEEDPRGFAYDLTFTLA